MIETVLSRSVRLVFAGGVAVGLGMAAHQAYAQEAAADAKVQRVEVTGSNIRRADKEQPSPVQVLTADDLKKSGYTSVSDALRDITANGQGTLSQGFGAAFARGGSGIALRGLLVSGTLVLIDGHRMAPYPMADDNQHPFVDISAIPLDAVERIDVLKDGSSAVYGSDAIAGVVNVILKKSYKGAAAGVETGTTQKGGGTTTHASFSQGIGDLDEDGYSAFGMLEYRRQEAVRVNQRDGDWTRRDFTSQGGNNLLPGSGTNPTTAFPATQTPYLINGGTNYFFPGGSCPSQAALSANQCTYTDQWATISPATENINFLAGYTKKLGGDWELALKASIFDSKVDIVSGPRAYPSLAQGGTLIVGPTTYPHVVNVINPFKLPASNPSNPLGVAVGMAGLIPDIGPRVDGVDNKSYRAVADISGSWNGWDINGALGYTKVVTEQTFRGYTNWVGLNAALNDPVNPWIVTGGNNAANIARVAPIVTSTALDELTFAELRGSHDLMALSGGNMAMSIGTSFVHNRVDSPDPYQEQTPSGTNGLPNQYALGDQNDAAAFVELYAPVLKTLEIDAAARVDHYNTYGNSFTPKIGFKFSPIQEVTLRGAYSKGFRAPSANESGNAGNTFGFNSFPDPVLCPAGHVTKIGDVPSTCRTSPAYLQISNPNLQPEKSRSFTLGLILEPIKGWSTTIDYYDAQINGVILSSSALPSYDPTVGIVRGPLTPVPVVTGFDAAGKPILTTQNPSVPLILYDTANYVNTDSIKSKGIELDTRYKFKLGDMGSLKVDLQWTHTTSYTFTIEGVEYQLAGTHGPTLFSGNTGTPRDRVQLTLGWDRGPLNITTTTNWVGSYDLTDPSAGVNDCQSSISGSSRNAAAFTNNPAPDFYCKVGSFVSTNLSGTYQIDKHWTVHGNINNLFNAAPPVDLQSYANTGSIPYNPSFHQTGAIGRFFNIGVNYKF